MITIAFSVPVRSELRNYYLANRQMVRVFGNSAFGDMTSEIWVFDITSTAPDNGTTVIKPLDDVSPVPGGSGRYILFEKMKKIETASGTTSGSGTFTFNFENTYTVPPNVQANLINGTDSQIIKIGTPTTTGVTVTVRNRTDIVGLLPTWSNVSGANVDILVTEK